MKSPQLLFAQQALYTFLRNATPTPTGFQMATTLQQRVDLGIAATSQVKETSRYYGQYFKWQAFDAVLSGIKPWIVVTDSEAVTLDKLEANVVGAIEDMIDAGGGTFWDIYFIPTGV